MRASHSCSVIAPGSPIESPKELRSHNGRLQLELFLRNSLDPQGRTQFCYVDREGDRSPTLRVQPGDLLILKLSNELNLPSTASGSTAPHPKTFEHWNCTISAMSPDATNLHFHGLSVSPACHADDSLRTYISPSSKPFVYRFRIPKDQAPGLYWYHPHAHGHSEEQVLGGASGTLIIEGIVSANSQVGGLPERILVIRDQKLSPALTVNSGRDPGIPAKDLSVNFVPVPYPEYPVGTIRTAPLKREFWRVLNASADTYVNLGILFNGEWRNGGLTAVHGNWAKLGLVAIDGVPISGNDSAAKGVSWRSAILIPPGGRAEFIFETPPEGTKAELITAGAETNPPNDEDSPNSTAGRSGAVPDRDDFTPARPLARIVSSASTREPFALNKPRFATVPNRVAALENITPVRHRTLFFSERVVDLKHPDTSTIFYLTEEGHLPKAFDPAVLAPDIVVHQGDVEDWTIQNRSLESHVFHIHQVHFLLLERDGNPATDRYLMDTVDVPYWDGSSSEYPSVKLRMDFRDPNIIGIFPYHCHILQHADGGMMGLIQVLPSHESGQTIVSRKLSSPRSN